LSEHVSVGRVGKPHGIAGAFFVDEASEDPERFAVGAELLVDGQKAAVVESKQSRGRPVIRLDRATERGQLLEVERAALPPPGEDEYYVFQLVGLEVQRTDGANLGRVADVEPGPANDVLTLDTGLLLPLVGACVREVDLESRRIIVEPGFDESD
jgi:16S rRNA processing protein RimM